MVAPLVIVLISGGLSLLLAALFRYERTRGLRFAQTARERFDHSLEDAKLRARRTYRKATGQTLRQSVRFVFHRVLTGLLRRIQRLEHSVRFVVQSNKNRANRRKDALRTSHFSAIADHKRDAALSEEEKRQRRDEALNGR